MGTTRPSPVRQESALRYERPLHTGNEGFSLLEVLVATMVLGIAVVMILQLFSAGLDQARRAEEHTRAVFHARAVMEEVLLDPPAGALMEQGDFGDGYRWALETSPDPPVWEDDVGVQPLVVRVTVGWDFDRTPKQFRLQTIVLVPLPEEPTG